MTNCVRCFDNADKGHEEVHMLFFAFLLDLSWKKASPIKIFIQAIQ